MGYAVGKVMETTPTFNSPTVLSTASQ